MENCALLAGGDAAFGEILRRCALARRSIEINMFIWRDDGAGNALARALLDAADRGVRVRVVKDRFGGAIERAEERGIQVDDTLISQLSDSVEKAQNKGVTNILAFDSTRAFVINVPNCRVITAISQDEMQENIFTHIDGAVIL